MNNAILAPMAALALWTMLVVLWLAVQRAQAFPKAGVDLSKAPAGGRGADIDPMLNERARWASHNYTHLTEQPVVFYAVIAVLAISGTGTDMSLGLAWAYVILRIIHSFWQLFVNKIPVRAALFGVSSICLTILAVQAFFNVI